MMWLIILVILAGLMVLVGLWKTYEAEGQELVRKPGYEIVEKLKEQAKAKGLTLEAYIRLILIEIAEKGGLR